MQHQRSFPLSEASKLQAGEYGSLKYIIHSFLFGAISLSTKLKGSLEKIVEEDCRREGTRVEAELPRYKAFLVKIKQMGKFDLLISMEGTAVATAEKDAELLDRLEKANLVRSEEKFTHRNNYRQYKLTPEGTELLIQLDAET